MNKIKCPHCNKFVLEEMPRKEAQIIGDILSVVEKRNNLQQKAVTFANKFSLHYDQFSKHTINTIRHSPHITKTIFGFDIDPKLDEPTGQGAWDGSTPVMLAFMLQKLKKTNSIVVIGPGPYGGEATAYSKETKIGVTALELNKRYVESGKKTAAGNKTKIKFIHSDLFTPFSTKNKLPNKVDYFIWNPPYVDSDTVKKNKLAISAADGGPTGIEVMSRALSEFKQLPPIQQTAKLAFCINTKRLRQQTVIKMIKDESFSVQEIFEVKHSPCKVFILKLHVASQ